VEQNFDEKSLPEDVAAALAAARAWITEHFAGRRIKPQPRLATLPTPELGEDAVLYAVLVTPGGTALQRIEAASVRVYKTQDMASAEALHSLALAECCLWVSGMPEAGKDPRAAARDFLKELREEPGSLGHAFTRVAQAALELCHGPEVTLGKPATSRTG